MKTACTLLLLTLGCQPEAPTEILGQCTWRYADALTDAGPAPARYNCLEAEVTAEERLSAEPIDPCEAPAVGARRVVVPRGQAIYRYYQPSTSWLTEGDAVVRWVVCEEGSER